MMVSGQLRVAYNAWWARYANPSSIANRTHNAKERDTSHKPWPIKKNSST
jgi:hypothetical protein